MKELSEPTNGVAARAEKPKSIKAKPPLPLPLCFMLSHLEEDGPVRLDGVKLGVCEVMGLELDEPKLGAFAGALNALDFPAQLLVRQHPPGLKRLRQDLQEAQPDSLPPQTKAASESLRRLLTDLEKRDGILDRRFYAVCEFGRIDELRGLLARAGLAVHPLRGRQLRMFLLASALGGSPTEMDLSDGQAGEETPVEVEINRRDMRVGGTLVRSLHLGKWPRSLAPGFLQSLMAAGAPMDLSIHLGRFPPSRRRGPLSGRRCASSRPSPSHSSGDAPCPRRREIALEDVTRLRDEVQRGRERLFHASLSITLHARDEKSLKEMTQRAKAHFAATLGKLDALAFRQREGLLSTLPLGLNAVAVWRTLDTSSLARLFPFSPPDLGHQERHPLRHRHAGLRPGGLRPLGRHAPERQHGGPRPLRFGKVLRHQARDAEGPVPGRHRLRDRPRGRVRGHARAAGGRVLSPGVPGQGMNPFVIERGDSEELLQRIGSLRRLIEVDGGGAVERRAAGRPGPRPGGLLRPAPRAHRLPGLLRVPARR